MRRNEMGTQLQARDAPTSRNRASILRTPSCVSSLAATLHQVRGEVELLNSLRQSKSMCAAAREPIATPAEVEAAKASVRKAIAELDDALVPASREFIEGIIVMLAAATPPPKGTDLDVELKVDVYAEMLRDYPPD